MKYLLAPAIVLAFYTALIVPAVELYTRKPTAPNPRTELLNKLR